MPIYLVIIIEVVLLISAYLLGSIPTALIVSNLFKGIDIRNFGSKNLGATNTLRVLGFRYGIIVFLFDALKAALVVSLFSFNILNSEVFNHIPIICYGIMAILGHIFPIFAKFKGGKGVACTAGILAVCSPLLFVIAFFVFIIIAVTTKYISLSSLSATLISFILSFFLPLTFNFNYTRDFTYSIGLGIITIIIFFSHINNIKNLIKHQEHKTYFLKQNSDAITKK